LQAVACAASNPKLDFLPIVFLARPVAIVADDDASSAVAALASCEDLVANVAGAGGFHGHNGDEDGTLGVVPRHHFADFVSGVAPRVGIIRALLDRRKVGSAVAVGVRVELTLNVGLVVQCTFLS
jgi:hypothetical protein